MDNQQLLLRHQVCETHTKDVSSYEPAVFFSLFENLKGWIHQTGSIPVLLTPNQTSIDGV